MSPASSSFRETEESELPEAIHIMHKSTKPDQQELLTEDEIADAAVAAEEEE